MSIKILGRFAACLALSAVIAGCGSGADVPELVPVTGSVVKDGQPVEGVSVTFIPEEGGASSGMTNAEGVFELYYNKDHEGAVPGKHTVRLSKFSGEAGDETIPAEFNEESTLTKDVTKEGPNEFKFEI